MISSGPIASTHDLVGVKDKVAAFLATAQEKASDGLSVSEFAELTVALLRVVMAAVDSLPDDGAQKKAWVLDAVGLLFDTLADKAIPALAWPIWLVVRGSVRSLVLMAAAGAIESMLPLIRRTAQ
jgi:hypothetical protein